MFPSGLPSHAGSVRLWPVKVACPLGRGFFCVVLVLGAWENEQIDLLEEEGNDEIPELRDDEDGGAH